MIYIIAMQGFLATKLAINPVARGQNANVRGSVGDDPFGTSNADGQMVFQTPEEAQAAADETNASYAKKRNLNTIPKSCLWVIVGVQADWIRDTAPLQRCVFKNARQLKREAPLVAMVERELELLGEKENSSFR